MFTCCGRGKEERGWVRIESLKGRNSVLFFFKKMRGGIFSVVFS